MLATGCGNNCHRNETEITTSGNTPNAMTTAAIQFSTIGDERTAVAHEIPEAHGLQCGYCTPGILMTLVPFLRDNPNPTEDDIRHALSGNLCRCTGYQHIVDAVKLASEKMK